MLPKGYSLIAMRMQMKVINRNQPHLPRSYPATTRKRHKHQRTQSPTSTSSSTVSSTPSSKKPKKSWPVKDSTVFTDRAVPTMVTEYSEPMKSFRTCVDKSESCWICGFDAPIVANFADVLLFSRVDYNRKHYSFACSLSSLILLLWQTFYFSILFLPVW